MKKLHNSQIFKKMDPDVNMKVFPMDKTWWEKKERKKIKSQSRNSSPKQWFQQRVTKNKRGRKGL